MSPVNDTRLSSKLIASAIISLVISMTACLPSRRPTGPQMVSDRLVDLLIRQQLPLGDPDSPLRGEVQRCGQWIREHLKKNPAEIFRLVSADNRLTATSDGATRLLVPELALRLIRLNTFFQSNAAVPRSLFTETTVRKMAMHPISLSGIQEMVHRDGESVDSETGGIVLANPDKGFLSFHVIEPDNARWVQKLRKTGSHNSFSAELKRIMPELPYVQVRAQRTLDILKSDSGTDRDDLKKQAVDSFMELLTYYSRYSYVLSQSSQYAAISEMDISGIYMGVFHVHPPDNSPSPEDKIGSLLRKNFVLVPKGFEIEMHVLDFRADPDAKPFIIRFAAGKDVSGSGESVESSPSVETPSELPEQPDTDWDDTGSKHETA